MDVAGSGIGVDAPEPDYQQCVLEGTSDASAGLRELCSEFFTEFADREVGGCERGDEKGADSRVSRWWTGLGDCDAGG